MNRVAILALQLYDNGPTTDSLGISPSNLNVLFDSNQLIQAPPSPSVAQDPGSILSRTLTMDVGSGSWRFSLGAPRGEFTIAWTDFFRRCARGGLLSEPAPFGVLYSLSCRQPRAHALAAQMTKRPSGNRRAFPLDLGERFRPDRPDRPAGRRVYVNPAYGGCSETQRNS